MRSSGKSLTNRKRSSHSEYGFYDGDTDYSYTRDSKQDRENLETLIVHFSNYDRIRTRLEKQGGGIYDLELITNILNKELSFKSFYNDKNVSLVDHHSLKIFLMNFDDLHLDIRRLDHGLPVYYLCRIKRDYREDNNIIVEDIYMSEGYKIDDERFVKLMSMGKEIYFLRLSHLREKLSSSGEHSENKEMTDEIFYKLGRHLFQAAWHEDQRLGILTARYFGIKEFSQAVELLYLCLNSQLCELRSNVDDSLLNNFMKVHPQQAIYDLIKLISGMEGSELDKLPRKALKMYSRLSNAFNKFLKIEVKWGKHQTVTPLYKILFGNFTRLELVSNKLKENKDIIQGIQKLEEVAQQIIKEILDTK